MTRPTDAILMAYVDGELEPDQRQAVEAAIGADPELAERVAQQRRLREGLARTYDPVLEEAVPDHLGALIQADEAEAKVVRPAFGVPRGRWAKWGAMAASLAVGAAIGLGAGTFERAPLEAEEGRLVARAELARALDEDLASGRGPVRIGLTFRTADGSYCRTFRMAETPLAGLACREQGRWAVRTTAETPAGRNAEYQMVVTQTPPAVLAAVETMIQGEPLDAREEAAALARSWTD